MSFLRMLKQTAVYWGAPAPDGGGGYTFDDPIEINVRWANKSRLIAGPDGNEIKASAEVHFAPSVTIEENGYLMLGGLSDLSSAQDENPQTLDAANRVLMSEEVPSMRGDVRIKRCWV